mgnify:CR=1 FL=1
MAKKKTVNPPPLLQYPLSLKDHSFYRFKLDPEQIAFRDAIWNEDTLIIFCNAKSGTGKTTIATATAHLLVEYGRYDGIVYIVSPYAEREQGYLPGGLVEKSEPYFQPFYQALEEIRWPKNSGCDNIECYTHTFLRGVNFQNKVVILDETQNFTTESLKKVLTRIHDTCKVIVIGHRGQIDLINKKDSGFAHYINYYSQLNDNRVQICSLSTNHRGWLSTTADNIPQV